MIVPIHRLKIIMIPKWIVVIPSAVHTGRKIGVKIRQAGVISINVPTNRSRLYTTATTEPSVAVKIPKMIPPITITIRSRQGRA